MSTLSKFKYVKREMDFGNPRYAASRKSSFLGGLVNGRHTQDGYYTQNTNSKKNILEKLEENIVTEIDDKIKDDSKEETNEKIQGWQEDLP
jgi:hypothetical protein